MKKALLSLLILPTVISNTSSAEVKNVVRTEVSGENASAKTEITNIINQKEIKVESFCPGEIKMEVKNGEVVVESSPEASPTVIISELGEEETKNIEEETGGRMIRIKNQIFSFMTRLFSSLSRLFLSPFRLDSPDGS